MMMVADCVVKPVALAAALARLRRDQVDYSRLLEDARKWSIIPR